MVFFREYDDLADTLIHLKRQVKDSLAYARSVLPAFDSPEELFSYLKARVIYLSDPLHTDKEPIELLMTMQTMMKGTRTGKPGAGDCDDFTITSLASLKVSGFNDLYVILVGRKKSNPVHIYAGVKWNGKLCAFDLTNSRFDYERVNYKYKQPLKCNI